MMRKSILIIELHKENKMKKEEKKEYRKPELVDHENLNEVTKGSNGPGPSDVAA